MLAVTLAVLLYAYYVLSTDIILGVSDTAPFSGWSIGKYQGMMTLFSMLATLLILATTFSDRRKKAGILTDATGFPERSRVLVKSMIIGGYFLVLSLLIFIMGCVFMSVFFGETAIGTYAVSWCFTVIPCLFLILGVSGCLGRKSPVPVFVFMGVLIVAAFILYKYGWDINGAGYYESMSADLTLAGEAEPAFTLSFGYVLSRLLYLVPGAALLIVGYAKRV